MRLSIFTILCLQQDLNPRQSNNLDLDKRSTTFSHRRFSQTTLNEGFLIRRHFSFFSLIYVETQKIEINFVLYNVSLALLLLFLIGLPQHNISHFTSVHLWGSTRKSTAWLSSEEKRERRRLYWRPSWKMIAIMIRGIMLNNNNTRKIIILIIIGQNSNHKNR